MSKSININTLGPYEKAKRFKLYLDCLKNFNNQDETVHSLTIQN
jgi:hypothetical protein